MLALPFGSMEAGRICGQGEAMPFDGRSRVRFDHDPDAVKQAFRESAGETIAELDRLAALFDGGRRWLRNKDCDDKGRFCLRGGIAHIAASDYVGYYLRAAIRELAGRPMSIPAFNDHAPNFADIAYVIGRAREMASADVEGQTVQQLDKPPVTTSETEHGSLLAANRRPSGSLWRFMERAGWW
jgi:uncharacterized protein YbjT (DUF2867 family)